MQQRYDRVVASTGGLGYPIELCELSDRHLVACARLDRHVRPGGTLPGPVPLILVDGLAWLLLVAQLPDESDVYTTDMGVQFMSRAPLGEVEARLTLERLGRSRATVSALVSSAEPRRPLTKVLLGFSLRRAADSSTREPAKADGR